MAHTHTRTHTQARHDTWEREWRWRRATGHRLPLTLRTLTGDDGAHDTRQQQQQQQLATRRCNNIIKLKTLLTHSQNK